MEPGTWGVRGIYTLGVLAGLVLAAVLWQNRDKKAALTLAVLNFFGAYWAFCLLLSTLHWDIVATTAMRVVYFGVGGAVVSTFLFALEYTGRERYLSRPVVGVFAAYPILLLFMAVVNPNELFFTDLDSSVAIGVEQSWGIAFWVHTTFSYFLILIYFTMLFVFVYQSKQTLYRGQAAAIMTGLIIPVPLNLIYLAEIVSFDTTPFGSLATAAFFTIAIVGYQYTNLSPIAREKVINNVRDGMIVIDTGNRIVDSNPAAREILGRTDSMIGSTIQDVLPLSDVVSFYEELTASTDPSERTVSFGEMYINIETSPIYDDRDRHIGWLFLIQDVTEQKQRERDLEQQIEKLDQFASLVSHDLRNPINVASGYIQQAKTTGNLSHLDKAEEATDRMEVIIQDVLALAREGQDVTDPVEVSVKSTAREAWETVETKGATLEISADSTVIADGERLQRLFENLFRNAIEHGCDPNESTDPDPSELTITVGTTAERATDLTLFVADNGVGIPPDSREQVFEDGYSTGSGGTGLGLAIVEQIAAAHGWEVAVTESESGGAQFEIQGLSKPL